MEPREKLQAALAVIEARTRAAKTRQQGLEDLATDTHARVHQSLERYQALLPVLGAGTNRAMERDYATRLHDRRDMTLAPLDADTPAE